MNTIIIKFFLFALLALSSTMAFSSSQSRIVAIVNDNPVTALEVDNRLNAIIALNNIDTTNINLQQMSEQILFRLIEEKLLADDALANNISVNKEEMEYAMKNLAAQNNLTKENLLSFLKEKQIDKEELEKILRAQIIWSKIVKDKFEDSKIVISPEEIKEQFDIIRKYQKNNTDAELQLAEIVINTTPEDNNSKDHANNMISAINSGADFKNIVKEFSISSSKENGGEIGWVKLSQLAPEIIKRLKDLKIGQVSSPIEQENNIMIFKVLNKRNIGSKKFGASLTKDEKDEINEFLKMKKINAMLKSYMSKIKRDSFIEIRNK